MTTANTSGIGSRQRLVKTFLNNVHKEHPGAWSLSSSIATYAEPTGTDEAIRKLATRHVVETGYATINGNRRAVCRIIPADRTAKFHKSTTLGSQLHALTRQLNDVLAALGDSTRAELTFIKTEALIIDHQRQSGPPIHHRADVRS